MLKVYKVRYLFFAFGPLPRGETLRNKIAIFVLSSLTVGMLVAGCGSDSGGDSASGDDSVDKATFVKEAASICKRASGRISAEAVALGEKKPAQSGTAATNRIVRQIAVPGFEAELEEIRGLGVPEESSQQVEAFFQALEKMIKLAKADPYEFALTGEAYEDVELVGRKFGLVDCPFVPVSAN
jgi:hypothetical protein